MCEIRLKRKPPIRWTLGEVRDFIAERGYLRDERPDATSVTGREVLPIECLVCHYEWPSSKEALAKGRWCPRCANREPWSYGRSRAYAAEHGGAVDSLEPDEALCGGGIEVRMRCRELHTWITTAKKMEAGSWCRECARALLGKYKRSRWYGRDVKRVVAGREDLVLSQDVPDDHRVFAEHRISLRCASCCHEWTPMLVQLLGGQGCPKCAGHGAWTIRRLKELVAQRGGTVVTDASDDHVVTSKKHVTIRCAEGHEWPIKPNNLDNGYWCPECCGKTEWTIGRIRQIVTERNGELITSLPDDAVVTTYKDSFRVRCENGHEWQTTTSRIQGHWCGECSSGLYEEVCRAYIESLFARHFLRTRPDFLRYPPTGRNLELDGYCPDVKVAFEHQGLQHYQEVSLFKDTRVTLEERQRRDEFKRQACASEGVALIEIPELHVLTRLADLRDVIIKQCTQAGRQVPFPNAEIDTSRLLANSYAKARLNDCYAYAASRLGVCHSTAYMSDGQPLDWECQHGHRWASTFGSVVRSCSWCPDCGRLTTQAAVRASVGWDEALTRCRDYAAALGGKCLSTVYEGCDTPLAWECSMEHTWNASYTYMMPAKQREGRWCTACANLEKAAARQSRSLQLCQQHAAHMGGVLESTSVVLRKDLFWWRCACGYRWPASAAAVLPSKNRPGTWCPRCRRIQAGHSISRTKQARRALRESASSRVLGHPIN